MHRLELTILKNLIHNSNYARKVIPFLKSDYFNDLPDKHVFEEITSFIEKYKHLPTHEALVINFNQTSKLKEQEVKDAVSILSEIESSKEEATDEAWFIDQTEKFCQDKAIYLAMMEAISIMDGADKKHHKGSIPEILSKALAVSFDNHVGHDYLDAWQDRFDLYHHKESKLPFDIDLLNLITKGGIEKKTLNIILGGINVGKTLILCHLAASYLLQGKNVLYITLEMAEHKIAQRIDANILNISLDDIMSIPKSEFERRVENVRNKTTGKLFVKEYPTSTASTLHFRALLNELALKKNFFPDVILIDYINICSSARIKPGTQTNSYYYVKSIAEEFRGLAVEFDVPVWSATQVTRGGFESSDLEMTDTSESFGLPATADFMIAVVETEDLVKLNQYLFKQLKNRYGDKNRTKRFVVGVDKAKMRLYNLEESAQQNLSQDQVPDEPKAPPTEKKFKLVKKTFKDFKV